MVFRFSEPRSPRAILKHQALLYDSLKPRVPFAIVTVVHLESVPLIIHHPLPCRSRLCFVITPCTHAHGTEIAKVILLMLVEQNRSKQNIPFAWCVRLRTQGCRCSCEGGGSRAVQNARPQNVEPEHRSGSICLPTERISKGTPSLAIHFGGPLQSVAGSGAGTRTEAKKKLLAF